MSDAGTCRPAALAQVRTHCLYPQTMVNPHMLACLVVLVGGHLHWPKQDIIFPSSPSHLKAYEFAKQLVTPPALEVSESCQKILPESFQNALASTDASKLRCMTSWSLMSALRWEGSKAHCLAITPEGACHALKSKFCSTHSDSLMVNAVSRCTGAPHFAKRLAACYVVIASAAQSGSKKVSSSSQWQQQKW